MSQLSNLEPDEDFIDDIADDDYVFVLDAEGQLKSVLLPEDFTTGVMPEVVDQILKLLNASVLENQTIH